MLKSWGFRLYELWLGRREQGISQYNHPRPDGRLLWLHLEKGASDALYALARSVASRANMQLLVTQTEDGSDLEGDFMPPPFENSEDCDRFLTFWRPDLVLIGAGALRPILLACAHEKNIPLILVQRGPPQLISGGRRLFPRLLLSSLQSFSHIFSVDKASRLSDFPLIAERVRHIGKLSVYTPPESFDDTVLHQIAHSLGARPVWAAVEIPETEYDIIVNAHLEVLQHVHRLVLVLHLRSGAALSVLVDKFKQAGRAVQIYVPDAPIAANTDVIIMAEDAGPQLCCRLSSITYMGGSFSEYGVNIDPFTVTSLGSVPIVGGAIARFSDCFALLPHVKLSELSALGAMILQLQAPDIVAKMVCDGWQVCIDRAMPANMVIDAALRLYPDYEEEL